MTDTTENFTVTTSGNSLTRALAFIKEWQDANADADIEIRGGKTTKGENGLCVTLNGKHHAFTARESRVLVEVVQSAIDAMPAESRSEGLPNLVKGLTDALHLLQPN